MQQVYFYAAFIPIVAYSIILHEMAHAVAALWAGDDTAKLMNRITLNPIPHVDLFGTIILPGVLIIIGSPVIFGWAKPVPVNPYRFRKPIRDDIIVSLAGVAVNLLLAYIFILLLHLASGMNVKLFIAGAAINIVLAVFNLIPIPPLDGSHVFKYLLPKEIRPKYEMLGFYGMFLIFIFLVMTGELLGTIVTGAIRVLAFLGGHGW